MVSTGRSRRLKAVLVLSLLLSIMRQAHATSWQFGGLVQTLNTGGSITFNSPSAMVVDPAGDVFVADTGNHQIVEVNAYGAASVLTISGLSPALVSPTGIAIDGSGNLYITDADPSNSRVVKVTSSAAGSVISTGAVILSSPKGVALDQSGDIFIADTGNNRIVEVTSVGSAAALTISGLTSPATLNTPMGLAVDTAGNLYITDSVNNRVVKVAAGATTGTLVSTGELDPALNAPSSVAVDGVGNIYIASTGSNNIAEIDTSGSGTWLFNSSVYMETASFQPSGPLGVALDVFGTVYVVDSGAGAGHDRVLIVDRATNWPSGTSSLNGSAVGFGHVPLGVSTAVTLTLPFVPLVNFSTATPFHVFTSGAQNQDFTVVTGSNTNCSSTSDYLGCTIQVQFLPTAPGLRHGAVVLYDENNSPIITVPLYGFADAPVAALAPNTGTVVSTGGVPLSFPFQIALDGAGNIYDANDGGNLVKIPAGGGTASVVSPSGYTFSSEVTGVAVDGAGNLFISDHNNNRIIVITPGSVASILSISGLATGLALPTGLAFDAAGNLYISDYGNGRVVEVSCLLVAGSTSSGVGTVIATKGYTTSAEGITGVAVDSMGNIYIPDGYAGSADPSRVIKVTAAGAASLLTPTGITFSRPEGVTADGMGNLYVADGGNNRIVEITTAGVASVLAINSLPSPTTLGSPFGITVDPFGNLYIPDSGNNRVLFSNVSGSVLTFPSTATGATSAAKTATVTNLGDQPLVFATNPTYTANFSNYSSDTNPCTASLSLAAGTHCDVAVNFTPQSAGNLSAGITVTNNTLNVPSSTQQVSVSGTGIITADTTSTAVTITPNSLTNGQTVNVTATVSDTATGHTSTIPTGQVTFTDLVGSTMTSLNGGSPVSLSGGAATLTGVRLSGIGTHTITAAYAGVSNSFQTSSNSATAALSKASVTIAGPPVQPVTVTLGQTASVVVTLTGSTNLQPPSGTLSYTLLNASGTSVASGTPALTAGNSSSTASISIPGTLTTGAYTLNVTYSGDSNYLAVSTPTIIQVSAGQIAPTISWSPAATAIAYGASLNGILDATATNGSTALPGTFVYTATLPGGSATTVTSASVLAAGSYILTATFTPTDNTTYAVAIKTVSLTVGQATPTISWTPAASGITYGTSLSGILNATAANRTTAIPGNFTYTAILAGGSATTVTSASVLAAGSYILTATFTPTDTTTYSAASKTASLTVGQATPSIGLNSSLNTVLVTTAVTFTAGISSSSGAPTGTISFYDGTALLGTVSLSQATASFTTSGLAVGTHSITAVYSGDANFASVTSSAVAQVVQDFSLTGSSGGSASGSTPTQTVVPGGTATYTLALGPISGVTFPVPVTLTVSGLPPGATATVSPQVVPAGSPLTNVTLSVQLPSTTASLHPGKPTNHRIPTVAWGVLLLPFLRRLRRTGRRLSRTFSVFLVCAAAVAATAGLGGCGSNSSGFFANPQQTYSVVVTATAGTISRSTTVTLIVQ
jgi:DNA-binding beta-propeller fold protein YncE